MTKNPTKAAESRAIDRSSFPMRLWSKSKIYGVWNPADIDLRQDREDWTSLPTGQRERLLQLFALFHAGEEAVTADLLPLIAVVADEGRIEEEMYLTSFLWEEAKHVDAFDRFFTDVAGYSGSLSRYWHPSFQQLFTVELPEALARVRTDASPEAQVRASVTYHIVVEGLMAETGYFLFDRILEHHRMLSGMRKMIRLIRRDEARHIAFGVYFLSRLVVEHGNRAYRAILDRMWELRPLVEASNREFVGFLEASYSLGVDQAEMARYSEQQFAGRMRKILRARTQTLRGIGASPARPALNV